MRLTTNLLSCVPDTILAGIIVVDIVTGCHDVSWATLKDSLLDGRPTGHMN